MGAHQEALAADPQEVLAGLQEVQQVAVVVLQVEDLQADRVILQAKDTQARALRLIKL